MPNLKASESVLQKQVSDMFRCKNCGGFLYEEEFFFDEENKHIVQLGCYQCSQKIYIESRKWESFKKKVKKAKNKSV